MIEQITLRNFKSLVNVTFTLGKFNCLVGMNGAGKSTVLQAIDFICQQMHGDISGWLESRNWESKDLYSRTGHIKAASQLIFIGLKYRLPDDRLLSWEGKFNRTSLRLTQERIAIGPANTVLLDVADGKYKVSGQQLPVTFEYTGSILSTLVDSVLPTEIKLFRDAIKNIKSLELLSPHLLRKRSRKVTGKGIGSGGETLSSFLDTLDDDEKKQLLTLLRQFYPDIDGFRISTVKGGWKRLVVSEAHLTEDGGKTIYETDAGQLNDGLLRILAIMAQTTSPDSSLLLLDEIENGINPEIIETLVDILVNSPMQIIVTTHSPMILNYLHDDVARASVQLIYKSPDAHTRIRHYFDSAYTNDKLAFFGPGEVFIDSSLQQLTTEFLNRDEKDKNKGCL